MNPRTSPVTLKQIVNGAMSLWINELTQTRGTVHVLLKDEQ